MFLSHLTVCASLLIALAFLPSCVSSVIVWEVRTESTPRPPSFNLAIFEQEPVAVLEAISAPPLRGNESGIALSLQRILQRVAPDWKLVSSQETTTLINKRGLETEYSRMRADYELSGILDHESLRKIGTAIGARYVFQPRLVAFTQTMTDRWKLFDVRVTQTSSIILRLSLQLWGTEDGELIWASTGEAAMQNEALSQEPVYLSNAVRIAWASIMTDLLYGRTSSTYSPINKLLDALVREKPEPDAQQPNTSPPAPNK